MADTDTVGASAKRSEGLGVPVFRAWLAFAVGLCVLLAAAPGLAKPPSWDKRIDGKGRFKVLKAFDSDAVLDKETGLVWFRTPGVSTNWASANGFCINSVVGDRRGWRLPAVHELTSLIDLTQSDPALPAGHPFGGALNAGFWTATTMAINANVAWTVQIDSGFQLGFGKTLTRQVWCVRAPGGIDGGH